MYIVLNFFREKYPGTTSKPKIVNVALRKHLKQRFGLSQSEAEKIQVCED